MAMADVFRILDRFNVNGRGIVYTVISHEYDNLHLNDVLFDLWGREFRLKGIEMIGRKGSIFEEGG